MAFKIRLTHFKKLERLLLPLKKLMLTMKSKLLFQLSDDQDFQEEIKEINRMLENLCKGKEIKFINNINIDGSCLNRSKLHLNKSGTALLVKNFQRLLSQIDHAVLTMVLLIKQPTLLLPTIPAMFHF